MPRGAWVAVAAVLLLAGAAWAIVQLSAPPSPEPMAAVDVGSVLGGESPEGFARARGVRAFQFPRDHGPHPAFRNEWWYFTGNLHDPEGRRFGFELSLFRIALSPQAADRDSAWATNQVYMGHFAVTDVERGRFHSFERFARAGAGLSGARADPFAVWLEDWEVRAQPGAPDRWRLQARNPGVTIDLELAPQKPPVLQGDRGLSRKSAQPGNASYYYSITRMTARGRIALDGTAHRVSGRAWLDREWSTSALSPEQEGWDWFGLQLDDGHDLMFYRLRRKDGAADPHSQGTLVDPQGQSRRLYADDVVIEVLEHWTSPHGGEYPAAWRLAVEPVRLELEIRPLLADQELSVSVRYWEGAVAIRGRHNDQAVRGQGYVEMTGYAEAARRR